MLPVSLIMMGGAQLRKFLDYVYQVVGVRDGILERNLHNYKNPTARILESSVIFLLTEIMKL